MRRRRPAGAVARCPRKTRRAGRAVLERFFGVQAIAAAHIIPPRNGEEGGVGRTASGRVATHAKRTTFLLLKLWCLQVAREARLRRSRAEKLVRWS